MPGVIDLLAGHEIGRHRLFAAAGVACEVGVVPERVDVQPANNGTIRTAIKARRMAGRGTFQVQCESQNKAARVPYSYRERHECRQPHGPSATFMFRFPLIAPMTRT